MMTNKKQGNQSGGININGNVNVNGDIIGRDKITSVSQGMNHTDLIEIMQVWEKHMVDELEKANLSKGEKGDIKNQVESIKSVVLDSKGSDPTRLEKLINMLAVMSPDIFDVAVATLTNPLAGIGLVLKKISDRVKLEVISQ